ncbi:MAG: hypothetical protein IJU57_04130 [Clostridia bacterium]|nr:hypothetical protein [Clostridia bacterium]
MSDYRMMDTDSWLRYARFVHFTEDAPCAIWLTDDIDVTELVRKTKNRGIPFYPAMLYCVSKVINAHEEFKMTAIDSPLFPKPMPAVWNTVHPAHNVFRQDSETFVNIFTLFTPDPAEFIRNCSQDIEKAVTSAFGDVPGPSNTFEASCVPWRSFTSVGSVQEAYPLSPIVVWGRHREISDGRILMPLSVEINHACADGYHLARFISETEEAGLELSEII